MDRIQQTNTGVLPILQEEEDSTGGKEFFFVFSDDEI
jgi:hypothetical protein